MPDFSQFDNQYNALNEQRQAAISAGQDHTRIDQSMQDVVAQRDAAAAQDSQANEAWHKKYQAGLSTGSGGTDNGSSDRQNASSWLASVLQSYGMGGMSGSVDSLIQQWGSTNYDVIGLKLKDTQGYKDRFKGLLALQQRGQTDVTNEAQFIALESDYRSAFREAGLSNFLGTTGSQTEYDKIASLVNDYSVSVAEVKNRISDSQRVVANTPQEVKDSLLRFYNVPENMLLEYSLDKTQTQDRINTVANAAVAGGYAARAGLDLNLSSAEQISGLSQGDDVSVDALTQNFQQAREVRDATVRLANIDGSTLSDSEVVQSSMGLDSNAASKVKLLQSKERARFDGKNAYDIGTLKQNSGF